MVVGEASEKGAKLLDGLGHWHGSKSGDRFGVGSHYTVADGVVKEARVGGVNLGIVGGEPEGLAP